MFKSNKGSISLYVLMTMIFILILVSGVYISSTNKEISGMKETEEIKNLYQKDVDNVDAIYQELVGKIGYIKDGLVVHYDGINNTGIGHSQDTKIWNDLSGNQNHATFSTDNINWEENCFSFTNPETDFFQTENNIELGTSPRTIEIVCSISTLNNQNIVGLGTEQENQMLDIVINNISFNCNFYNNTVDEGITQVLSTDTTYHTAFIYKDGKMTYMTNDTIKSDIEVGTLDTASSKLKIGQGISSTYNNNNQFKIYSVRIYNRVLTEEEINNNYNVDKERFDFGDTLPLDSSDLLLTTGEWDGEVNSPRIEGTGLTPITYGESGEVIELSAKSSKEEWYDYANKEWANAITKDENGNITGYFVWIPRFAYKITSGLYTNTVGTIEVKFLQGTTNYDSTGTKINNTYPTVTSDAMDDFVVHPAFEDGSETGKNNNYMNGEWDTEIEGFWVAKYEAGYQKSTITDNNGTLSTTISNSSDTLVYSNEYYTYGNSPISTGQTISTSEKITYPVFKPLTYIFNCATVGDMYTIAREVENGTEFYGLSNIDSHLMKNSEWGALAYLTQSQYGKASEPYKNNYHISSTSQVLARSNITGVYASSPTAQSTTVLGSAYYTETGIQGSSTGNITGVYDINGAGSEYVSVYITNSIANAEAYNIGFAYKSLDVEGYKTRSTKYVTVYPFDPDNDTNTASYENIGYLMNYRAYRDLRTSTYGYGDAILETSGIEDGAPSTAWNGDFKTYPSNGGQFLERGGLANTGIYSPGIFAFSNQAGNGYATSSFRVCLIPTKIENE